MSATSDRDLPESYPASYRLPFRDRLPGPVQGLARFRWWTLGVALFAAMLLADQVAAPNSRVIKAVAGVVLLVIAYRTRPFYALCFITLFLPFPFSIFIGSSTLIFVVLVWMIYLARLSLGKVDAPTRTPIDPLIGVMLGCYILSFYNVNTPDGVRLGVLHMLTIISSILLYYMTASFIRTEEHLRTFVKIFTIMIAACIFVGLWELFLPGVPIIPHWILIKKPEIVHIGGGYRIGGPFYDFELYGEFMAMSFFFLFFVYRRATTPNARFFLGAMTVLSIFALLATVTRGATLSFLGGLVYLIFLLRKRLKFRDLVAVLLVGVAVAGFLEFMVSNFTVSGSVITRLFKTKFEGVTPDSRAHWPMIWERVMDHPFIGHGPYYDLGRTETLTGHGLNSVIYPHSQYLFYAHTIGITGMLAFIALGGRLVWVSLKTKAKGLQDPSFPRALMLALHVMLVVFLVDQIKIENIRNPIYQFMPWLLFGVISATHRIIRQEEQTKGG